VASSRSSSASSSTDVDSAWQRVAEAILGTPGALTPAARARICVGDDPAELAPLLDKVRRHAYRIGDGDVAGLGVDTVVEAALAAALGEALNDRRHAFEAIA
jgi:hypothetical protein